MEKQKIIIVVLIVFGVALAANQMYMNEEIKTLEIENTWAMELAKIGLEEKQDIMIKIKEQIMI
jgi:hypothetical protein